MREIIAPAFSRDFVVLEHVGAEQLIRAEIIWCAKPPRENRGDGGVRVRGEADAALADHAEGADHHTRETRIQHRHLEVFHEEGAEIATENAPDIRRQERQPGEQRDFLDVHAAHG